MDKKITVVVPVYNAESHLERCLGSLVNQTLNQNEQAPYLVAVYDDGSTDDSCAVARKFQAEHPNLISVATRSNKGAAVTRNEGISKCVTPYLMFVDNDDYVDNDYLERHLKRIEKTNADIVISGYRREMNSNEPLRMHLVDSPWSRYQCVAPWARIFNTEFLHKNNIAFFENNIGEDTVFSLKAYRAASKIEVLDYIGYAWCCNEASVSNTLQKGLKEECQIIRLLDTMNPILGQDDPLAEYYLYRYVVWYLLFSGKDASPERFCAVADQLYSWLALHGRKLTTPFWDASIKSEPLGQKLAVSVFDKVHRLGMVSAFAHVYCRGKS